MELPFPPELLEKPPIPTADEILAAVPPPFSPPPEPTGTSVVRVVAEPPLEPLPEDSAHLPPMPEIPQLGTVDGLLAVAAAPILPLSPPSGGLWDFDLDWLLGRGGLRGSRGPGGVGGPRL